MYENYPFFEEVSCFGLFRYLCCIFALKYSDLHIRYRFLSHSHFIVVKYTLGVAAGRLNPSLLLKLINFQVWS